MEDKAQVVGGDTGFEEFEKTHFKVIDPVGFVRIGPNGKIQRLKKGDLHTLYENKPGFPTAGGKEIPYVAAWLKSKDIRTYERVDLLPPPLTVPNNVYNTWSAVPATHLPSTGSADLMIKHIEILFGEKRVSDYVLKWFANIFQTPAVRTDVAMVWTSEQGAGKGIILEQLMSKLLGTYFAHTSNPKNNLFSKFGEFRNCKLLVNIDDACDIKACMEEFKPLITGERITYEAKFEQTISYLNCSNYIVTTQRGCPIKLDASDRRWAVFECDNKLVGQRAYFKELGEWLKSDANVGAFYEFLMALNIKGFNFADERPLTNAYHDIKMLTADKELLFLASVVIGSQSVFKAQEFFDLFRIWISSAGFASSTAGDILSFGTYMSKLAKAEMIDKSRLAHGVIYKISDKPKLEKYLVSKGVQIEEV
jgi:hypothetical protein